MSLFYYVESTWEWNISSQGLIDVTQDEFQRMSKSVPSGFNERPKWHVYLYVPIVLSVYIKSM